MVNTSKVAQALSSKPLIQPSKGFNQISPRALRQRFNLCVMMPIDQGCVFEGQTCVFTLLYLMSVFVQSQTVIKGDRGAAWSILNHKPCQSERLWSQNIWGKTCVASPVSSIRSMNTSSTTVFQRRRPNLCCTGCCVFTMRHSILRMKNMTSSHILFNLGNE